MLAKNFKKALVLLLALVMIVCVSAACGKTPSDGKNEKLTIVATIFPVYDWVREVLGDEIRNVELVLLMDSGVDLHSFQPTAKDVLTVSTADLFIYVGGESDEWVEDILSETASKDLVALNLLELLGDKAKEEELVEGMEGEEEEDEEEGGEEGPEYDEHVWLSLKNAQLFVNAFSDALGKLDTAHAKTYADNAAAYGRKLSALDASYQAAVDKASVKTVMFCDRFPFRYLTDDYGLSYYAAFIGCSAETEASFSTISFLSGKLSELDLPAVITLESSDGRIARTVVQNTDKKAYPILRMDSLQSVTSADVSKGVTYLSVMEKNLSVLTQALG